MIDYESIEKLEDKDLPEDTYMMFENCTPKLSKWHDSKKNMGSYPIEEIDSKT